MTLQLRPANTLPFDQFIDTFNAAYSDYLVPIQMQPSAMRRLIERDSIDLSVSWVAVDDEQPVGVGMLAHREGRAWIGGMGVIPDYRRRGIGKQLMLALLSSAEKLGVSAVDLEVIETNTPAYALYRELGFIDQRRLLVLERLPRPTDAAASEHVEEVRPYRLLEQFEAFHAIPNPWQRGYSALRLLASDMHGWQVMEGGALAAYAMGWALDDTIRFMDIGVRPGQESALEDVLTYVHNLQPEAVGSLINLPAESACWPIMQKVGYVEKLAQIEMTFTDFKSLPR